MRVTRLAIFVATCASVLVVGVLVYFYYPMTQTQKPITQVVIANTVISVEVESTDTSREQGLSGRTSLADGSGMLFVFEQPGTYGFWMKDMNFAIDMIFADSKGRIVTIAHHATPESYTENPPQVFYPSAPALYVLEVPAGFAAEHTIEEGMILQFK